MPPRPIRRIGKRIERTLQNLGIAVHKYKHPLRDQRWLTGSAKQPVIFDLGAHYGQSIARYKNVFPGAIIHSFEPLPEAFQRLQSTYGDHPDIHIVNVAVCDAIGTAEFQVAGASQSSSLFRRAASGRRYYHSSKKEIDSVSVHKTTLNAYAAEHAIGHIDILKMDIQGAELRAMQGADALLANQAIDIIFCEVFFRQVYESQPLFLDIADHLETRDYSLYDIYSPRHASNGQLVFCDALFVCRAIRKSMVDAAPDEA